MKMLLVLCILFLTSCSVSNIDDIEPVVSSTPCPVIFEYDFSLPVKESMMVSDTYLDDSVFIGDSRTEVLKLANLDYVHVISKEGIAINKIPVQIIEEDENNNGYTVYDLLKRRTYNNIYIMLGYNELGWVYSDIFIENYIKIIDTIKEIQPNADIYVLKIYMPTIEGLNKDEYASSEKIVEYNNLIQKMCIDKKLYFIDTDEFFVDETGHMKHELTEDGIHLKEQYVKDYLDFIKSHVVKKEDYEKVNCDN